MEIRAPGRGLKLQPDSPPVISIDGHRCTEAARTAKAVLLTNRNGVQAWFPIAGVELTRPGWLITKSWLLGSLSDDQRAFFGLGPRAA